MKRKLEHLLPPVLRGNRGSHIEHNVVSLLQQYGPSQPSFWLKTRTCKIVCGDKNNAAFYA